MWLHMKNFESEIVLLKTKINRFENIASVLEDTTKCRKLDQILENIDVDDLI